MPAKQSDGVRHPASVGDSDTRHYPTLAGVYERAARRGIDLDASTDALIEECRVKIPPTLLLDLTGPWSSHGTDTRYQRGCRCLQCKQAGSDAQRVRNARRDRRQAA